MQNRNLQSIPDHYGDSVYWQAEKRPCEKCFNVNDLLKCFNCDEIVENEKPIPSIQICLKCERANCDNCYNKIK